MDMDVGAVVLVRHLRRCWRTARHDDARNPALRRNAMLQDFRSALRLLVRERAFAVTAALTLALGIGANTAIFTVVAGVLLRPLPFTAPDELVTIQPFRRADPTTVLELSYPDFADVRDGTRTLASVAAYPVATRRMVWEVDGQVAAGHATWVTGTFFETLGVNAHLGRTLGPNDDLVGAPPVAVISHGAWQRRFGGAAGVVGRPLSLNARTYTIVGVMPPGFEFPEHVEAWTPLLPEIGAAGDTETSVAQNRAVGFLRAIGRLAPGASREAADAEVDAALAELSQLYAPPNLRGGGRVVALSDGLLGEARRVLLLLVAAAALVLLIACANVANLFLARGAARAGELGVRRALGASRWRLIRQLGIEALVLALLGGTAAVWICALAMDALVLLAPAELYRAADIALDGRVFAFAALTAGAAAVISAVVPALQAAGVGPGGIAGAAPALRATASGRTRRALRAIMAGEVALALVLLRAGVLLARSFARLGDVRLGFDRADVYTVEVFTPPGMTAAAQRTLFERLAGRAAESPGITSAAGVLLRPLEGPDGFNYPFTIEGRPPDEQSDYPFLNFEAVTLGYFETMGIPLLAGRAFDARDRSGGAGVVIISDAVARRFFPGTDPVGQRIKWGTPEASGEWLTVVGVAGDARYRGLRAVTLDAYVPHTQSPWPLNHLVVRSARPPAELFASLRVSLAELDAGARLVNAATVSELVTSALRAPRFLALLVGIFALLAAALAGVGIYGVVSFVAVQRTSEVGIRVALGAGAADVYRLVLRESLIAAAIGIGAGLAVALAGARLLEASLFGVHARDPLTFAGVALFLGGVALLAGLLPARRAAATEPSVALRSDTTLHFE
jgi:predicted permease